MPGLRIPSPSRRRTAVMLTLLLALAAPVRSVGAPGGSPAAAQVLPGDPLRVKDKAGHPAMAVVEIDGSVGGMVSTGQWTVVVPPGAFEGTGKVRIHVPNSSTLRCDLSIAPGNLNGFKEPVLLFCNVRGVDAPDPTALTLGWFDPALGAWVQVPGVRANARVFVIGAPLQHFSSYGVFNSRAGW